VPTKRLTDRTVRGLDVDAQTTFWDEKLSGFGVRVTAAGTKTFVVRYRFEGKRRRYKIGRYPEVSLADARESAKNVKARVQLGEDPAAVAGAGGPTFEDVAKAHLDAATGSRFSETHADRIRRAFENDVYPAIGDRPISDVSRRDVAEILEGVVTRGSPVMANRLKSMISGVFEHAFQRELVDSNPAKALRRPAKESSRERVLEPAEIRELWQALEADESPLPVAVVKLRFLTGQRGKEVRYMRRRDLQGDTWIIPAEHHKADKRHTVPLTSSVLGILGRLEPLNGDSEWIFPSDRRDGPIQRPAELLERLRERVTFAFQLRDIRRTVATRMADDLQVPRLHIAKVLGHKVPGVTSVYDKASYASEKLDALERWAERLEEIVGGDDE
jgi:integrase